MKLLGISLATLLVMALIWSLLFVFSSQQSYEAYDHPLLNRLNERILALEPETFETATEFIEVDPRGGLVVKLHMSKDGHFFTASQNTLDTLFETLKKSSQHYVGPKTFLYTYDFLKSQSEDLIPLEAWLQLKPSFWVIDILTNAMEVDKYLIDHLKDKQIDEEIIIRSDTDIIVSSLKESKPQWLFGSSQSDMTEMLTMALVKLEGLPRFNRDIYFSPLNYSGRSVLNGEVFKEIRKRKKKVAIGPVHTESEREQALVYEPDILIVSEAYLKEFVLQ
ncbi:MAG: hypothetical protein ACK5V3_03615 [Bdellovibrionales bacterium]